MPAHVLNDIMYGFTAELVWVPKQIQELGTHWAEAKYNLPNKDDFTADWVGHLKAIVEFADPEIFQRAYEFGDELAEEWDSGEPMTAKEIEKKLQDDWVGFLEELKKAYPWIGDCQPCPGGPTTSDWGRDWSRDNRTFSDGKELKYV